MPAGEDPLSKRPAAGGGLISRQGIGGRTRTRAVNISIYLEKAMRGFQDFVAFLRGDWRDWRDICYHATSRTDTRGGWEWS